MKRNLWRLVTALVISAGCYAGTEIWYASSKQSRAREGRASIARLTNSKNEVQRKEVKRVIWEGVTLNDEFYPGEAIRTTDKAEAQILLIKSGAVVHLEPDSLVVLEENENGLALDFLQGNLFVQGAGSGGAKDLTLKTGSGEIKLKSADMSLTKDQSGQVNLEVYKGQAELSQGDKKMALTQDKSATLSDKGVAETRDRVQLVSPQAGTTVLLNFARGEKLELTWKPLGPEYRVTAEIGGTRSSLAKISDANGAGESGKLSFHQKPGKWFVRLVAQSSDGSKPPLISATVPIAVEPKAGPMPVSPSPDSPVVQSPADGELEFKWLNRNVYSSILLEISRDRTFANPLHKKSLAGDADSVSIPVAEGSYYWRVSGFLATNGKNEALSSAPQKLQVVTKLEIKPVTLLHPAGGAHIPHFEAARAGVSLKWQTPVGVKRVKVTAQRQGEKGWTNLVEKEVETTFLKVAEAQPGAYRWKVASLNPEGEPAAETEFAAYTIEDMPRIEWTRAEPEVDHTYYTPAPSLQAQWKPAGADTASYRYRVWPANGGAEDGQWKTAKNTTLDTAVAEDGKYMAVVEALNAKGQPVAQSDPKTFVVKRLPLLPPPQWLSSAPDVLKSDSRGNLSFGWQEVPGATEYLMILENQEGKVVDQRAVGRNGGSLTRLKPGQYQVKLKSVDSYRRPSAEGAAKKLEVPNMSDIRAPKIKAMKVK